ncbi:Acetamidase, partial [Ascosphaera pollenicola]
IEDFFRLVDDAVRFHPKRFITSELAPHILSASMSALSLQQHEPLIATLHYLHDLLSFGLDRPTVSNFSGGDGASSTNPPEVQAAVKKLMASQGTVLVQRILTGMMFTFPADCFLDASTVVMLLFELLPQEAATWVEGTIQLLPAGSVKPHESGKLMQALRDRVMAGDSRRIRSVIQDGETSLPEKASVDSRPLVSASVIEKRITSYALGTVRSVGHHLVEFGCIVGNVQ